MRYFLKSIIYSNVYIAGCAWMMTWETQSRFLRIDHRFLLFIFSATLATYYFHALVNTIYDDNSDRHLWNSNNKGLVISMLAGAILLAAYAWWPYRHHIWPMAAAALATFLYSAPNLPFKPFVALRNVALGKTVYLAGVWTYVTTLLPMLISGEKADDTFYNFLGHRFFLVYAICILFDRKDKDEDMTKGVRTLATMGGEKVVRTAFFVSLIASAGYAVFTGPAIPELLVPIIVMAFQYPLQEQVRPDMYYFLFMDGMMMLSSFLHLVRLYLF